ncbi:MAG: SRPBCC family protein [Acidimicrobiia bacterium]
MEREASLFEFTETIEIDRTPGRVWEVLSDIERWWEDSNPEHDSLEVLDTDRGLEVGTRLRIHERIAGIPGVAEGEVTRLKEHRAITWEAPAAHYRWFGIPLTVAEAVTWTIEPTEPGSSRVAAHVWAVFPGGFFGRLLEWVFRRLLRGVAKDRAHARTELRYLKGLIEAS